jgi:type I restriction enzyme S subunit
MSVEKKVPEIRFEGFKGQWSEFSLGELGSVATNKRIFMHQTSSIGEVPFFKIGTFGKEPQLFISLDLFEDYKKRFPFPNKGDLLFSVIGSIGRVVEYTGENEYFQDSNIVWLKHDGKIVNSFLKQFYSIVEWSGLEGSTIKHLYNRNILETKIKMPSPKEQAQIGNYFQKLDSLIKQHQQKHDKLSNLKKAMLEKMFPKQGETVPEIRFKGFSGEWEKRRLGDIGDTFTGLVGKTKDDFGHGEGRFVTYMNVFSNTISNEKMIQPIELDNNQNEVKKGDVFFTTSSETPEDVGMSSIWMGEIANVYLNSFCFGYRPKQKISSFYLAYMLRANSFRKQIISLAQGVSRYNISKTKAMDITVSIPNFSEQEKIGNYFQKLDTLLDQHQQQITKLTNIKQACLSKMFV